MFFILWLHKILSSSSLSHHIDFCFLDLGGRFKYPSLLQNKGHQQRLRKIRTNSKIFCSYSCSHCMALGPISPWALSLPEHMWRQWRKSSLLLPSGGCIACHPQFLEAEGSSKLNPVTLRFAHRALDKQTPESHTSLGRSLLEVKDWIAGCC